MLALLLAVGGSSILAFNALSRIQSERRVRENAAEVSDALIRYFNDNQVFLQGQVHLVSSLPTIRNAAAAAGYGHGPSSMTASAKDTLLDRLDFYSNEMKIDGMAFIDLNGTFFCVSEKWPAYLKKAPDYEGLLDVTVGKDWSGIVSEEGTLGVLVATATSVGGKYPNGVLLGYKRISDEIAKRISYVDGSEIAFVKDAKVLAASRKFDDGFRADTTEVQTAMSGGRSYMGVYNKLPTADPSLHLGFIALRDQDKMLGPYRDMFTIFFVILVAAMIVGLVIGDRFARGLVKPLDDVVQAAVAMRKGETPTAFDIGRRRDEIAVLQMVFNDMVTAVQENQKLLLGMIDSDPLTGLMNHRAFQEKMREEVAKAKEADMPLSLVLVDLDSFHDYNLSKGHAEGDQQLKGYAALLRGASPGGAILARYAGDVFAVLLPKHDLDEAEEVARTIKKAASVMKELITTSIGVSDLDPKVPNDEALILSSELALSRAKQLGKNRIARFESDLSAETPGNSILLQQYLADGSLATVQALAAAVDAKDQYTNGHSERVANFARDLAEFTHCSPAFVELVYRAGTLHDVGKIGVPDAILSKPDRLTDDERNVMETHPVLGELIVGKVPSLSVLLPGVRSHHERWDGNGYPDGLKGEQIPMLARYLSVADTFDAMTSNRPYRTALSVDIALEEIEKNAGTQFQADIARAFVKMVRETSLTPA
ncbi:MAG TPA: HD domain-containing phosphohydrolase [Fimbriimonas sp.]|nr:HD domain-containing phosphohydrolase [Fimbriimonas sp.]